MSESHDLKAKKKISALQARRVIWLRNGAIAFAAVCGVLVALPSQGNFDPGAFDEGEAEAAQPRLFSMLARHEDDVSAVGDASRPSNAAENQTLEELDCSTAHGAKDDCQRVSPGGSRRQEPIDPAIKVDIEKASLPAPFGPFGDGGPIPEAATDDKPGPFVFAEDGLGMPIGPITDTLSGVVLPIVPARGGGTLPRTGPVGTTGPVGSKEPLVMDPPGSEVPLPAPLILFPAGLALVWKAKRAGR